MAARRSKRDGSQIREHGQALLDATGEVAAAARVLAEDVEALARAELRERPLLALGAAFAAGWVLAGALPARVLGGFAGRAVMGLAAARLADLGAAGRSAPSDEA
jgi:hypothetical protein